MVTDGPPSAKLCPFWFKPLVTPLMTAYTRCRSRAGAGKVRGSGLRRSSPNRWRDVFSLVRIFCARKNERFQQRLIVKRSALEKGENGDGVVHLLYWLCLPSGRTLDMEAECVTVTCCVSWYFQFYCI